MDRENRGYSLSVCHQESGKTEQKVYLKPMSLYVPDIANQAVTELVAKLNLSSDHSGEYTLTVTNNNNGVSVDKDFSDLSELTDPLITADAVKDLINIVRGYESDEETNVCGW
ncbi:DUF1869 domain-containing protein [Kosakonia cowanii]|uniref:DUF1869 domain-containing protein n=1 Tax=Kosakonia cowanii TaxID=208223 RepID=UPI0023FA170C|nr:DUF1869 domain-containing protein [Kosakonia cowanii]MDF7759279.1 DUF1869 domain-containing protein [Kosakonia cowanii]